MGFLLGHYVVCVDKKSSKSEGGTWKGSLVSLTVDKQTAKRDLITYCREQYLIDNHEQQQLITEFENEYTRDSFIYCLLNKAF